MSPSQAEQIHTARRHAVRELLASEELDALLVTDLRNIRYLTGFTGSNAALLLHAAEEKHTLLCTDGRYTTQVANEVPDLEVVFDRASALALVERANAQPADYGVLGFESRHVSVDSFDRMVDRAPDLTMRRTAELVERLRMVKGADEVDALRMACAIADRALADLIEHGGVRSGRTERQIARDLENLMFDHGSQGRSFETIVAAGAHSAIPHHRPTDAVVAEGDLVKLDFGAIVDGYHSDMTRTLVVGEPADWQRDLYHLVLTAQAAGSAAAVDTAKLSDVDAAARGVIERAGYGAEFPHGLGHGVGLQVHEAPLLSAQADGTLAAGMAVTVEPGVYLAGHGGVRIEDTVVAADGTNEVLTLSTKDLVTV